MQAARANRQEQTEAEAMLWELLRNRNFENIKFRRQHPIKDYIVDFFSYELKLVIELDGGYHHNPEQKEKDELRDLHLAALGYKVLRYNNEIVETGDEQHIYDAILDRKNKLTQRAPLSAGEGLGVRVLSTKKLQLNQRELLLNAGISFVDYDAISITPVPFEIPESIKNCIITSQNGAKAFLKAFSGQYDEIRCFIVGKKTARLLSEKALKVTKTAQNGAELAHLIAKNHKNETFYYFCGNQRRDELPSILKEAGIICNEVVVYETQGYEQEFDQSFDGVLFYSPSGVKAFAKANSFKNTTAFCIGETTATAAKKYIDQVVVANDTSVESVIAKAVKHLKKITN